MSHSMALACPRPRLAWRWIVLRLLLVLPALQLYATLRWGIKPPADSDYNLLYLHAELVGAGDALYWPWPEYGPHFGADGLRFPPDRIFYPPFLTPFLSTLSRWGIEVFAYVWVFALWVAYWVYAACLAKLSHGKVSFLPVIVWGTALLVVTGRAAQSALNLGNVDPLLWAFFGLALAVPAARGAGFVGLALVKLYGAWPLLFAAIGRDWRTVRGAAVTFGAALLAVMAILGAGRFVDEFAAWFRYMLPVAGQGTFNPYNISISFLGLRVARWLGWEYVSGPLPGVARAFLTAVGILAPLMVGWLTRRADPPLHYSLVVCAAVFFAPLAWNFYTALLLAPIAILLGRWLAAESSPGSTAPMAGLSA
jgi:hypothetical protein